MHSSFIGGYPAAFFIDFLSAAQASEAAVLPTFEWRSVQLHPLGTSETQIVFGSGKRIIGTGKDTEMLRFFLEV